MYRNRLHNYRSLPCLHHKQFVIHESRGSLDIWRNVPTEKLEWISSFFLRKAKKNTTYYRAETELSDHTTTAGCRRQETEEINHSMFQNIAAFCILFTSGQQSSNCRTAPPASEPPSQHIWIIWHSDNPRGQISRWHGKCVFKNSGAKNRRASRGCRERGAMPLSIE